MASTPDARLVPHGGWAYPRHTAEQPFRASQASQTSHHTNSDQTYPAPSGTTDPLAPRADAPIFRLQQDETSTAHSTAQRMTAPATPGGARYYSIHRQAGREPDTPRLPEPVYLDALPVELNTLPDSQDLAAPPPTPTLMRDAQGRIRPAPDFDTDPSLD